MNRFIDVCQPDADGVFHFPDDWAQGRTAFGGVQAAAALTALRSRVPDRPLRSASVQFIGPSGSAVRAAVDVLREGRSVTHTRCDFVGDDGVVTTLNAAFGDSRRSVVDVRPRRELPARDAALVMPYLPGITPAFTQHVELRWSEGGLPFTGSPTRHHAGWCRHRTEPGAADGALLGLLDAWPAPALQAFRGPAPASTVAWSAQLVATPPTVTVDDWFFLEAKVLAAAADGFATIRAEMWSAEGALVAHMEQLVAVFDAR